MSVIVMPISPGNQVTVRLPFGGRALCVRRRRRLELVFLTVDNESIFDCSFVVRLNDLRFHFDRVVFVRDREDLRHVAGHAIAAPSIQVPGAAEVWFGRRPTRLSTRTIIAANAINSFFAIAVLL